ncbi:MAG: hypothetical protein KBG28_00255 [Kofleriaceae bacterium]|nr:hypothetical protein [Kofleriaceae bacterium]MBP6841616.1 hypothetical protein [Kofleriaceae bacterium]MBP9202379.1 hypothetical protein [Kofleriaceae bacterium]
MVLVRGVATWWGYARGDRLIVTTVVVIFALAAVGFITRRVLERRRRRAEGRDRPWRS